MLRPQEGYVLQSMPNTVCICTYHTHIQFERELADIPLPVHLSTSLVCGVDAYEANSETYRTVDVESIIVDVLEAASTAVATTCSTAVRRARRRQPYIVATAS